MLLWGNTREGGVEAGGLVGGMKKELESASQHADRATFCSAGTVKGPESSNNEMEG